MTPNEILAITSALSPMEQLDWARAHRQELLEMSQRAQDPSSEEARQQRDIAATADKVWFRTHSDPWIEDGDLRWRWSNKEGCHVPITVVKVHRHPGGTRAYDVLRAGRLEYWSAQVMETETQDEPE